MTATLVEAARSLYDTFDAEAGKVEEATTLTPVAIDGLVSSGLMSALVPKEYGGAEADIVTAIEAYEEVSRADASIGWTLIANATTMGLAAAFVGDAAADELFGRGTHHILAGMLGPVGQAVVDDDGYTVSGRYRFGSGCAHASFLGGGAIATTSGGDMATLPSGLPDVRVYFVPRDHVELLGNWDVIGLVGTGSYDYEVPSQHVDREWTFPLLEATPQRGGPVYHLGVMGMTTAGHVGVALGIGRRVIDELVAIVTHKVRMGAAPLHEQQLFQHDFAVHEAAFQSARGWVYDVYGDCQTTVDSGTPLTPLQDARMKQATTYATRVVADLTRFCHQWAGTDSIRNGSVLQRCFRDAHVATQHLVVDNNSLTGFTQAFLGAR